jgi:hypothetical protein
MATPLFNVRLSEKTQADLRAMAAVYGSPNASAYAREVLEVMCSGDLEKVKAFIARLIARAGEQLTLKLNGALDEVAGAEKPAKKARKLAKTGKGAACRARPRKS